MTGKRILLIAKDPVLNRLDSVTLARLVAHHAVDLRRLQSAADNHERALASIRRCLTGHHIHEWQVDRLQPSDAQGMDLIITVGGDGTVLTANSLPGDLPMLTVNSDPEGSVGMFTRCTAPTFADLFHSWFSGAAPIECIPRLQVSVDQAPPRRILNECLVASANPAAMARYLLEVPGPDGWNQVHSETQRSSGVWIATAAGSTAAIHSCGTAVVEAHLPALLYQVREPFQLRTPVRLLAGQQIPAVGLRIIPAMPGISLYIDGPYQHREVATGSLVEFSLSPTPLRLINSTHSSA